MKQLFITLIPWKWEGVVLRGGSPDEQTFPIPLNEAHERAVKSWAADDRLWTTQDTVEFNLRTFARVILRDAALAALPLEETATFDDGWRAGLKQAREVFQRHAWQGQLEEILAV